MEWMIAGIVVVVACRHLFGSFHAQRAYDYQGGSADIRDVLVGSFVCNGVIYGPLGRVSSRFTADFDIKWEGQEGVMDERYMYDTGEAEIRRWDLSVDGKKVFARAADIAGEAHGVFSGGALGLTYKIKLEEKGGLVLSARDWMYVTPDGSLVNRSQFRILGIKVAELVAILSRKS